MKVVINKCFGGFGLSPKALKRWAELKGKKFYLFKNDIKKGYIPITIEDEKENYFFWVAFSVPNPDEYLGKCERDADGLYKTYNAKYKEIEILNRDIPRHDLDLIKVVEELGEDANGRCAELKVVEIPDGVDYVIEGYDGLESIHEKHRVWD